MINDILKKSSLCNFKEAKKGKKIILFGLGTRWDELKDDVFDETDNISYIIDNDKNKHGIKQFGYDTFPPEKLKEEVLENIIVLIANGYVTECAAQLEEMGIIDYFALYLFHDFCIPNRVMARVPKKNKNPQNNPYANRKLEVNIQITDICNLTCKMCISGVTKESQNQAKGEVPYEKIISILDQVVELRDKIDLEGVLYTSNGESLLHSRFTDIVNETKARNIKVRTMTNGVSLKGDIATALLKADATINISITGIIPEIYKDFQGYGGSIEKTQLILNTVIKNITDLVDLKSKLHSLSYITVQYLATKENAEHFIDYLSFFTNLGVDVSTATLIDINEEIPKDRKYTYKKNNGKGYCKCWADKEYGYFNSLPCFFPFIVSMNGDVAICCQGVTKIPIPVLGNVFETSLSEILFQTSTLKIINAIDMLDLNEMPELCRVCRHLIN